jgi:NAD(P)-dependent dehydrogenase (short-subunit alcohol dehydrogenase family)
MFVGACTAERQAFFTDPATGWPELVALMEAAVACEGDPDALGALGLPAGNAYGLSKACANTYTQHLAGRHPRLTIHACTPGWIATDMTKPMADAQGGDPYAMGMKTPDVGARTPLFLLFGDPAGSGHYFGSDAKRSPLDRYRSPDDPPYAGD